MSGKHSAEYHRLWRQRAPNYHKNAIVNCAKQRARKKGVPFSITAADITIPDRCPVLGIPIQHQKGGRQSDNSPSIDRIVPELGYVPGNVIVVSFRANRIKNDATLDELEAVASFYRNLMK